VDQGIQANRPARFASASRECRSRAIQPAVIDQYAEKALGNRDYFLNKPYGVG